jgi:hypothetical protein
MTPQSIEKMAACFEADAGRGQARGVPRNMEEPRIKSEGSTAL